MAAVRTAVAEVRAAVDDASRICALSSADADAVAEIRAVSWMLVVSCPVAVLRVALAVASDFGIRSSAVDADSAVADAASSTDVVRAAVAELTADVLDARPAESEVIVAVASAVAVAAPTRLIPVVSVPAALAWASATA